MTTDVRPGVTTPARAEPVAATRVRRRGVRVRRGLRALAIVAGAVAIGVFAVFPFYWMILTSIKPARLITTATPVFLPGAFEFGRYPTLFIENDFWAFTLNSIRLAGATTVLCVAVSTLAAYALARFRIPVRRYLILVILSAQMFPAAIFLIPMFVILRNLNLLNSLPGLLLAHLAFTVPLTVAILRGFFTAIPEELDEAAMIDGASRVGAMFRVVLPVAAPGIAATSIFAFISSWNEFIFALTFAPGTDMRVLPVALQLLIGRNTSEWGSVMAGGTIYTIPIVIFFLLVHRHLMRGMALGAVKG